MYSDWAVFAIVAVAVVFWLLVLTFLIWRQGQYSKSLFPKTGERDIRKKFAEVLESIAGFEKNLSEIKSELKQIKIEGLGHIQKVALLRFNPYEDTGGDQSFTVALLNEGGDGIVITSLHARSGTRVFAKPIGLGKGQNYQLSKEEEQVVKKAINND